ncbi:hypothetical protein Q1M64_05630 (plasmid) [Sinorhizobium meliloti]|nr:hypothetical protein Q1M64_05630 [Sinorhizobium meliloti]
MKGDLCLAIVDHAVSICVQAVKEDRACRLYLGKLKRSITVLIHLKENPTGFLSVRRTSAASREDNNHAGQQFEIHSIFPFLGRDRHQRELLRAGTAAPTRRLAFFLS